MSNSKKFEVGDLVAVVETGDLGVVDRVFHRHRQFGGGVRYRININRGPNCGRVITVRRDEIHKVGDR